MPDNKKTKESLQKLAPCIERGDLDACVEEAARVALEMGIGAIKLSFISCQMGECEKHSFAYILALAAAPNLKWVEKAKAYSNAGLAAQYLGKLKEAEECYKQAIESDPKFAIAHYNYAVMLKELGRKEEAEEHYLKTIELNPNNVYAHSNYAVLLRELGMNKKAEKHYLKTIELNPNDVNAYSNYANLLDQLGRKKEAEKHYLKAIEIDRDSAEPHHNYAILLIELNRKSEAEKQAEFAYNIFTKTSRTTEFHLSRAWFYHASSEKNFNRKLFSESADDADKAGDEYLKAAETVKSSLKDNLTLQGNVLKAKSLLRKIPEKSWYKKIYYRFGKIPCIPELIDNLKNAAIYYEKASQCPVGGSKDVCNACFSSMNVFSETLSAMSAFIKNEDADINKDKWLSSLEYAQKIYTANGLNNGAALVDTLKQLIKCVDELANHRKMGLHIQEEKLGKCYNNLLEVSEKLDSALKIIVEHSIEAIRGYAKKQGMVFIRGETKISLWGKLVEKIYDNVTTLIIATVVYILYLLNIIPKLTDLIKSLIGGP